MCVSKQSHKWKVFPRRRPVSVWRIIMPASPSDPNLWPHNEGQPSVLCGLNVLFNFISCGDWVGFVTLCVLTTDDRLVSLFFEERSLVRVMNIMYVCFVLCVLWWVHYCSACLSEYLLNCWYMMWFSFCFLSKAVCWAWLWVLLYPTWKRHENTDLIFFFFFKKAHFVLVNKPLK